MKTRIFSVLALLGALSIWGSGVAIATSCTCTATGFPTADLPSPVPPALTACLVNPAGTVSGTVDATGCDIGVYYGPGHSGSVSGAAISNASYYGVLVNGAAVNVLDSTIENVGPSVNSGDNTGILFLNGANCPHGVDRHGRRGACAILGNTITQPLWGKNGITAKNPGTMVVILRNTVEGYGPDASIAQNGIEIGDGAVADIEQNTVSGNQYTGNNNATGILIYGGPGHDGVGTFEGPNYTSQALVQNNSLSGNDIGVILWNVNDPATDPPPSTNNNVSLNTIFNDGACPNIFATGILYLSGKNDMIGGNTVYGLAY